MTRSPRLTSAAAIAVVAISLFIGTAPAGAASAAHCVVSVVAQRSTGEFVTGRPACYATFEEAMHAAGVDTSGLALASPTSLAAAGRLQSSTSSILGIHYDGSNWTGASTTVSGGGCSGGWVNVTSAWNDRISSTVNGCPRVRHFWDANLGGLSQDTTIYGGNLTTLDNETTSIQYLS